MKIASLITTKDRPEMLRRTLPGVIALGARVLVVDDGSSPVNAELNHLACQQARPEAPGDVRYLYIPENRGLAASLQIGLNYWLVDHDIDFVSYFQDDVQVDPLLHEVLVELHGGLGAKDGVLLTGHDAREHQPSGGVMTINGVQCVQKRSCRATQMFASRGAWLSVMPIRSKGVGYPKRVPGRERGEGSDVDWYITRDAPRPLRVWCVHGLVRTFAWEAQDSCWGNRQTAGEDPPMHRTMIERWLRTRKGGR